MLEISEVSNFLILALIWNGKLGKLRNIFKTCKFERTFLFEEIGNFRVFDFGPYTEIENSDIFSRLLNLNEFLLFEDIGNIQVFWVFDYGPYAEIENSEIFSKLAIVLLEEVGNFWCFPVFDFTHYAEIENSQYSEFFSRLVKLSEFVLF